jgi:hypothetical protein
MDWTPIIYGAIGAVGVPMAGFIWQAFLKRENTFKWGRWCGAFLSKVLQQRLGAKIGDEVEGRFATTLQDFVDGVKEGLASE